MNEYMDMYIECNTVVFIWLGDVGGPPCTVAYLVFYTCLPLYEAKPKQLVFHATTISTHTVVCDLFCRLPMSNIKILNHHGSYVKQYVLYMHIYFPYSYI